MTEPVKRLGKSRAMAYLSAAHLIADTGRTLVAYAASEEGREHQLAQLRDAFKDFAGDSVELDEMTVGPVIFVCVKGLMGVNHTRVEFKVAS